MFALHRKIRVLNLPIEMQIDLFNKLIKPILLYGCEIWAIGNLDIIERCPVEIPENDIEHEEIYPLIMENVGHIH